MMRAVRFPIAGLMSAVVVVALGLAALCNASETWAGAAFLATSAALCLAIVGILCRGESERAWWLGFALFGWGYLILAFWSSFELPTMALLDALGSRLGAEAHFSGGTGATGGGNSGGPPGLAIQQIAHCLRALLGALLGGFLATFLGRPKKRAENLVARAQPAADTAGRWWLWPAVLWLAGCVLITLLGSLASGSSRGFWAGATFLATCNLLLIAIWGAAREGGKRRQVWLGAALFGVTSMTLALGHSLSSGYWPRLPTDGLLRAVRPWFPPDLSGFRESSDAVAAANARIMAALEQPVPMRFPNETPLEDVLNYIQSAALGPDGMPIQIHVDPVGLQEADKTTWSTVVFDLDGVPLKTSLRLCLKQLDLVYIIRDGLLLITSADSAVTPIYQNPFLIVGHCLLALLAAGLGGIFAPLIAGVRRKPARQAADRPADKSLPSEIPSNSAARA